MVSDRSQAPKPPYVSFKTFETFLMDMKASVPVRIDRNFLDNSSKSGSTGTQLIAALRFLNLVNGDGTPTVLLNQLAKAEGHAQAEMLRQLGVQSYDFVFNAMDVTSAAYAQVADAFQRKFGLAPDVTRKCVKFFVSFATAAGISLSSRITKKKSRGTVSSKNSKMPKNAKTIVPEIKQNLEIPIAVPEMPPPSSSWCQLCLETTFPRFDLNWTAEQRSKWYIAFRELVAVNPDLGQHNTRNI